MKLLPNFSIVSFLTVCVSIPASASVTVSSPYNNTEVGSSFTLSASAANCSSQAISAMGYSFDNSADNTFVYSSSINAQVQSSLGSHTLHVKAWGNKGASCVTDVAITVAPAASTGGPSIPSGAISVSGIQVLSNWLAEKDGAVGGTAGGAMSLVSSPSYGGTAREFWTNYSNYGNERYYVSFGDDTSSTNFLYDTWVYIPSSSTSIANLEMDMNQVMPNGQTVIFGFQCDGWSGTWDYTANTGTPTKPVDQWLHSGARCNVKNWSKNTWHHVQVNYFRNNSGYVNYSAVWLDGVKQQLNVTVFSAFALGWSPTLLTNFQVDGAEAGYSTSTVYMDDLTIYRW